MCIPMPIHIDVLHAYVAECLRLSLAAAVAAVVAAALTAALIDA